MTVKQSSGVYWMKQAADRVFPSYKSSYRLQQPVKRGFLFWWWNITTGARQSFDNTSQVNCCICWLIDLVVGLLIRSILVAVPWYLTQTWCHIQLNAPFLSLCLAGVHAGGVKTRTRSASALSIHQRQQVPWCRSSSGQLSHDGRQTKVFTSIL